MFSVTTWRHIKTKNMGAAIGVRANFFLGGLSHLCPKKNFRQRPKKKTMLTCKITLPDSPIQQLLVKIPDFGHFFTGQDE